ncbi:MAG TPA: RHS repeat-associated core domain-containing protein [Burkholderiales bacterium]|nr:RHS repeat-associated core domain-containing protein [Burkholderiales bacterium]
MSRVLRAFTGVGAALLLAAPAWAQVSVSLSAPTEGSVHLPGANLTLSATASASSGYTLSQVEFFHGTTLIGTDTSAPYSITWSSVPQGNYTLTAKATAIKKNQPPLTATSTPVSISVTPPPAAMYFIHVDHLNTPRLVANQSGQTVWRWDQQEPFGNNPADENPSGLGAFDLPLRLPGQYFDKETNLHYNYFRDYDPSIGRYVESDPIGLEGGLNTYAYGLASPIANIDPIGLEVRLLCRPVRVPFKEYMHCFVYVTCPEEGWRFTLSLFGNEQRGPTTGDKAWSLPGVPGARDDPTAGSQVNRYNQRINPSGNCNCGYERSVIGRFSAAPQTLYYGYTYSNSNTFAQYLITSPQYGTSLPPDVPANAPGFNR